MSSIFIGTAFAAFLTGITEPLEFSFMFLAPVLYVIHAILSGLSGVIMSLLDVRLGFGFSAGLIDYILNWPLASKPIMLIPVGLAYFVLYYFLFRFTIVKFNLKTPGREDDDITEDGQDGSETGGSSSLRDKAEKIVPMLGGKENIKSIDACITRLRLVLEDDKKVDEKGLKSLGAAGIMKLGGGSVQVVFGTQSELIKEEMLKL